jgi:MtN3 and saliva related transmembrane protein
VQYQKTHNTALGLSFKYLAIMLLIVFAKLIGIIAGVLTGSSLLPQLIKILKEKKGGDISIVMLLCLLFGLACWVWYGILQEDWPIIITNAFSLVTNGAIIVMTIYYKQK